MPSIIYNEGRVTGFSAYEIYVRQHMAELGEDVPVASEREWLASMLDGGSAILLKVPKNISAAKLHDTSWYYIDIALPSDTKLCAANTITGHMFLGQGNYASGSNFARSVASYGDLVGNTSTNHPSSDSTAVTSNTVPPVADATSLDAYKAKVRLYSKIVDGVVIQPGHWSANQNAVRNGPAYYLDPDLTKYPVVRLKIAVSDKSEFNEDIEILLVGWTNRSVVAGQVGTDTAAMSGTPSPSDGDFLGPATFPWASKIVFVAPSYGLYQAYKDIDSISEDLEEIHDAIHQLPTFDAEYQPFQVQSGRPIVSEDIPNSVLVIHKKFQDGTDAPFYALSLKDRLLGNKSVSTTTINTSPDGYIYWEDLIPALHKQFTDGQVERRGRVDALTSFLRQLSNVLQDAPAGQYVINVENGAITLGNYVFSNDEIAKYKVNLIEGPKQTSQGYIEFYDPNDSEYYGRCRLGSGSTVVGNKPMFKDMKLDLFGYVADYNNGASSSTGNTYHTYTLNMLATLTMIQYSDFRFNQACDQWYQKFQITEAVNLRTVLNLVLALRKGSANSGLNSILFASGGRSMLRTANEGQWGGGCWVHTDIMAYIRIKGIINAINTAGVSDTIQEFTRVSGSGSIKGVVYGRSDLIGGSSAPYSASGSFSSCSVVGAVGITERLGGENSWPSTGTLNATARLKDGSTTTITIPLS